jgi:hypothetical protein
MFIFLLFELNLCFFLEIIFPICQVCFCYFASKITWIAAFVLKKMFTNAFIFVYTLLCQVETFGKHVELLAFDDIIILFQDTFFLFFYFVLKWRLVFFLKRVYEFFLWGRKGKFFPCKILFLLNRIRFYTKWISMLWI